MPIRHVSKPLLMYEGEIAEPTGIDELDPAPLYVFVVALSLELLLLLTAELTVFVLSEPS